jgi:serine/threonine-protein kinase HipA
LALRPEEKYQSTWERVVGRIKDVASDAAQQKPSPLLAQR